MPRYTYGRYRRMRRRKLGAYFNTWKKKTGWRRRARPARTGVKTGFLKVIQKTLTQVTLDSGPHPLGIVDKYKFEIADIPQFSTYSALFDQYRLTGVKMTFLPTTNTDDTANVGGTFISSIDLDGDTTITTFDDILQCSNSKTSPWSTAGGMTPYKKLFVKPRTRDALVRDVDPTTNLPVLSTALGDSKQWIDLGDRGKTEHYGFNVGWYFGNAQLNNPQELNVITTYYISFRKVR